MSMFPVRYDARDDFSQRRRAAVTTLGLGLFIVTFVLATNSSAYAASPTEMIKELRVKSGHAPTIDDFYKMQTIPEGKQLDRWSLMAAWNALRQEQKPSVEFDELMKTITEKRDGIKSLHCTVDFLDEDFTNKQTPKKISSQYQFAHSADVFYARQEMRDDSGKEVGFDTRAYDGKDYRHYSKLPGQTEPRAGILPLDSKHAFFEVRVHPLNLLMLLNSAEIHGKPWVPFDLAAMFAERKHSLIIFEHPEVVDQVSCTIVAASNFKAYLDTDHSFVLRRMDFYSAPSKPVEPEFVRELVGRRTYEKFTDAGGGYFLPQLITTERYQGGVLTRRETSKVTWGTINQPLLDSFSKGIIPKGTRVLDTVRKKIYLEGIPDSDE